MTNIEIKVGTPLMKVLGEKWAFGVVTGITTKPNKGRRYTARMLKVCQKDPHNPDTSAYQAAPWNSQEPPFDPIKTDTIFLPHPEKCGK